MLMVTEHVVKNVDDLAQVIGNKPSGQTAYLGEVLVNSGHISKVQLEVALAQQVKEHGKHIGRILVEMGMATPAQINAALAHKLNIPLVKLEGYEVPPETRLNVPTDLAMQYNIFPLGLVEGKLIVAMENPLDQQGIDALRFNTNQRVEAVMVSPEDMALALSKFYSEHEEVEAIEDMALDPVEDEAANEAVHVIEQQAKKKPIVRLLNAIVLQAVTRGASDINIRPERDRVNVYYRIDGKMQFSRALHKSLLAALVSRIKIIGQMNIAERRLSQDGHARLVRGQKVIDLRISIIPTVRGESVVIRILDKDVGLKPLVKLGLHASELTAVRSMLHRPHGLFLVTGPTGSGKSTTMYALLNEVKQRNPHILTVEDPVEYDIDGIEQVQVANVKGNTFSTVLRHFLRHDPDVIMVGEIRDAETAAISTKASLTGHLVFSTLHTNDAPSAATRLLDMGVEPYLLGSTLLGVMAQRLIRVNCPKCLAEECVEPAIRRLLNLSEGEKFYRGQGCSACGYTGFKGRTTVCELMVVTPDIAALISESRPYKEIADMALKQGMHRLGENVIKLARMKRTSIEEAMTIRVES